jgi:hypothetical protein
MQWNNPKSTHKQIADYFSIFGELLIKHKLSKHRGPLSIKNTNADPEEVRFRQASQYSQTATFVQQ